MFDINDFDETLPGPWEWDVKRLAASMLIAARDNGFAVKDQERVVLETVEEYRTAMRQFAAMRNLDVWYAHLDVETALEQFGAAVQGQARRQASRTVAKARTRDSMSAFSKLTEVVDGEVRIVDQSPLIVPIAKLAGEDASATSMFEELRRLIRVYRSTLQSDRRVLLEEFELHDVARKVVGVGSVGTRAWIALLLGRDGQRPAVPADEGGRAVGARGVPRPERVRQPRPARRDRPAPDAGHQRHLPRLAARRCRARRRQPATSTGAS